jgi:hypothetical protein
LAFDFLSVFLGISSKTSFLSSSIWLKLYSNLEL